MKTLKLTYNCYRLTSEVSGVDVIPHEMLKYIRDGHRVHQWLRPLLQGLRAAFPNEKLMNISFYGDKEDALFVEQVVRSENVKGDFWILSKHTEYLSTDERIEELIRLVRNEYGDCVSDIKRREFDRQMDNLHNNLFEVPVVSVRSCGKSMLVNALLQEYLSPVSVRACTQKITSFVDDDTFKKREAVVKETNDCYKRYDVGFKEIQEWNRSSAVKSIQVRVDIPGVDQFGRQSLVLIDTPGVDGSEDKGCRASVLDMLKKKSPAVVIYVLDSEHYDTNDNALFLKEVCRALENNESNARDVSGRVLFVVNKIDRCADAREGESDVVASILEDVRQFLVRSGIENPVLLPLSAKIAAVIRGAHPETVRSMEMYLEDLKQAALLEKSKRVCGAFVFQEQCRRMAYSKEIGDDISTGIQLLETWLTDKLQMYAMPAKFADCVRFLQDSVKEVKLEAENRCTLALRRSEDLKLKGKIYQDRLNASRDVERCRKDFNDGKPDSKWKEEHINKYIRLKFGFKRFCEGHVNALCKRIEEICQACDTFGKKSKAEAWEKVLDGYGQYYNDELAPQWERVFRESCEGFRKRFELWSCLTKSVEFSDIPAFDEDSEPYCLPNEVPDEWLCEDEIDPESGLLEKGFQRVCKTAMDIIDYVSRDETVKFAIPVIRREIERSFSEWLNEKRETLNSEFLDYCRAETGNQLDALRSDEDAKEMLQKIDGLQKELDMIRLKTRECRTDKACAEKRITQCSEFVGKLEELLNF